MRKFGVFSATVFISIIVAGLYGIIHDQITYSISPEYFTKFKYGQFGFDSTQFGGDRQTVAAIGFLATWWMGLIMGFVIATVGTIFSDHIRMKKVIVKAFLVVFITAFLFAAFGFLWGKYDLGDTALDWPLPDDVIDKKNFIIVGSIHDFSYLGGLVGLLLAIAYMIRKNMIGKARRS